MAIQGITPFLWYERDAEEAADFYVSLFENSRIIHVSHYGDSGPGPKGSVMAVWFELEGRPFMAINGGSANKLSEAFSLLVSCTDQADIDRLWEALGQNGSHNVCGWLKDRFGLSWQINYAGLADLMTGDPAKVERVFRAQMTMTKVNVQALKAAAA
jgi:predicted 3-demethylubiquinone-9 3-methyltransferase (glyoxalase superfamily)